jgi:methionine synthase I (cobalamin-dependent)
VALNRLELLLSEHKNLLVDGGMGTQLFAAGLQAGDPPELWNLDHPDRVLAVHQAYVDAGSDVILTNSFGANRYRLMLHKADDRVHELNEAAARVARKAADGAGKVVLVAGSMGPTGELLDPMGTMTIDECEDAFAEQAAGLAAGGADLIWVETTSDLDEVSAAVRGAQRVSDLPVAATMSFDTAGRTMMGVKGEDAVRLLSELGVAAFGANCGNNLRDTEAALLAMAGANTGVPLICKANAGIPEWKADALLYNGTPEVMGAHAKRMMEAGVSLIGACCGSTAEHLSYMRRVLDGTIDPPMLAAPGPVASGPTETDSSPRRARKRRRT